MVRQDLVKWVVQHIPIIPNDFCEKLQIRLDEPEGGK